MLLQVHDELVFDAPRERSHEPVQAMVVDLMSNAFPLSIPLDVEAHIGTNWGEIE